MSPASIGRSEKTNNQKQSFLFLLQLLIVIVVTMAVSCLEAFKATVIKDTLLGHSYVYIIIIIAINL